MQTLAKVQNEHNLKNGDNLWRGDNIIIKMTHKIDGDPKNEECIGNEDPLKMKTNGHLQNNQFIT